MAVSKIFKTIPLSPPEPATLSFPPAAVHTPTHAAALLRRPGAQLFGLATRSRLACRTRGARSGVPGRIAGPIISIVCVLGFGYSLDPLLVCVYTRLGFLVVN